MASSTKPAQKRSSTAVPRYVWQQPTWPTFTFDHAALRPKLDDARLQCARLVGQVSAIGLTDASGLERDVWVQDALATTAIEGERLDANTVRSSVCRRLGLLDAGATAAKSRSVDGLIDVMEDASLNFASPLTADTLCGWQAALFPSGRVGIQRPGGVSGIRRIATGR